MKIIKKNTWTLVFVKIIDLFGFLVCMTSPRILNRSSDFRIKIPICSTDDGTWSLFFKRSITTGVFINFWVNCLIRSIFFKILKHIQQKQQQQQQQQKKKGKKKEKNSITWHFLAWLLKIRGFVCFQVFVP